MESNQLLHDDWNAIIELLPSNWQELAQETKALTRRPKKFFYSASNFIYFTKLALMGKSPLIPSLFISEKSRIFRSRIFRSKYTYLYTVYIGMYILDFFFDFVYTNCIYTKRYIQNQKKGIL
jgi:hypothetical protein